MDRLHGLTDVCLSGGAAGADLEWGRCASSLGHAVIHWSFAGHDSAAPEEQLVRLSDGELELADSALAAAADALGKSPPRRRKISSLLQRNYYQVAWSRACYAVTVIPGIGAEAGAEQEPGEEEEKRGEEGEGDGKRKGVLPGGTAWAVAMFVHLHPGSRELYVFDQEADAWFRFAAGATAATVGSGAAWERMTASPPRPHGVWAGIGSRDLRDNGRDAIRRLMDCDRASERTSE